jgi:hypothetical protein
VAESQDIKSPRLWYSRHQVSSDILADLIKADFMKDKKE